VAKKKAAQKTVSKAVKTRTAKSPRNGSKAGTYTTPSGNVLIDVPSFWMFRQTNDDLQLVSPSGEVSLIVNAYSNSNGHGKLDAREYLDHLLGSAPKQSRVTRDTATRLRAAARYKDTDGTSWCVEFITDGKVLLLAEISSNASLANPEGRTALGVLGSVKIKPVR
jgi:hypothetical protein